MRLRNNCRKKEEIQERLELSSPKMILQNDLPRKGVVQTLEDLLSLDKESNVEIVILQRPEMDKNGHPSLNLISCHGMK